MHSPSHGFYILTSQALCRVIVNQGTIVPRINICSTISHFFRIIIIINFVPGLDTYLTISYFFSIITIN